MTDIWEEVGISDIRYRDPGNLEDIGLEDWKEYIRERFYSPAFSVSDRGRAEYDGTDDGVGLEDVVVYDQGFSFNQTQAIWKLKRGEVPDTCPNCEKDSWWDMQIDMSNGSITHFSMACKNCGFDAAEYLPVATHRFIEGDYK